jgi:hypothetical protein
MPASPINPGAVAADGGRLRWPALWLVLLAVAAASSLIYLHIVNAHYMPSSHSDLLPRWVGTRAALQGEDPYSAEVLRRIQIAYYGRPLTAADHVNPQAFFYPATIIVLLAPLAAVSWPAARLIFLLVTCPLLAWSFWLCMRTLQLPASRMGRAVVMGFALFSWAVIWALRQQQPGLPVVIALFLAFFLLSRRRQALPGILLALATIKPQLVLPLLLWLLVWAVLRRMWPFVASFTGAFALLLAATEWIVPGWFTQWRAQMRTYAAITHTSMPLEWSFGHWPGIAVTLVIAAASALALWRLRRCEPDSPQFALAVSLALATTTTLILGDPSLIYNDILLFPACLILIFQKREGLLASAIRILALVQLVWDYVAPPLAIVGESHSRSSGFWISLPFRDYFLPTLATLSVLIAAAGSVGLALPLLKTHLTGEVSRGS